MKKVLNLSYSLLIRNLLSFVLIYLLLSFWIYTINISFHYVYVQFSRFVFILYLLLVFVLTCRFFAWFFKQVLESIKNYT